MAPSTMGTMSPFQKALQHTLGIEGVYSDHPSDRGGKTNYGITEAKARAWGYTGEMKALPLHIAVRIYREDYWDLLRLSEIAMHNEAIAIEMFDTAVNCGPSTSVRFLQRLLNVFNREEADYEDIPVDSLVGRLTLAALALFLRKRGELGARVMLEALNSLQGAYYAELAERRPANEQFAFGWFSQRVLQRYAP